MVMKKELRLTDNYPIEVRERWGNINAYREHKKRKRVSNSEREGAPSDHKGSRKVSLQEHEHRGARGLDREARDGTYHLKSIKNNRGRFKAELGR